MVPQRARIVEQREQALRTRCVRPNEPRPPRNPKRTRDSQHCWGFGSMASSEHGAGKIAPGRWLVTWWSRPAGVLRCGSQLRDRDRAGGGGRGFSAYNPSLPDCCSDSRTIEAARRNLRKAIRQHVAARSHERAPPDARRRTASGLLGLVRVDLGRCRRFARPSAPARERRIPTVAWTRRTKGWRRMVDNRLAPTATSDRTRCGRVERILMIRYTGNTGGCVSAMPVNIPEVQGRHARRRPLIARAAQSGRARATEPAPQRIRANPSLAAANQPHTRGIPMTTCARTNPSRATNPNEPRPPAKAEQTRRLPDARRSKISAERTQGHQKKGSGIFRPARPRGKYGSTPGWRWCLAAPSLGSGRRTRNGAAEHPPAPAVAAALCAPASPLPAATDSQGRMDHPDQS